MKRILLAAFILLTVTASSQTYPVTDNFLGSGPLSSKWTDLGQTNGGYVTLQQASGTAVPSVAAQQGMGIYTGANFNNDQFSQIKMVAHVDGSLSSTGPCVRMSASGSGVCYLADIGQMYLLSNGGGAGNISSSCPIPAAGDTIQISVIGSTYTCTDLTTGDSANTYNVDYPTGSPAFIVDQRPSSAYAIASFEADCIPTCNVPLPPTNLLTFHPPGGTYTSGQSVAISTTISPSTIYYTTNGTPPTTSSSVYSTPVPISLTQTLKAIAVTSASADYFINASPSINVLRAASTYPVIDDFPDSGPLSSQWTDLGKTNGGYVPLQQASRTVVPTFPGQQGMGIYTGAIFADDQFSQIQILAHVDGSLSSTGPCVRMSPNGSGVCYLADIGQMYLLSNGGGAGNISSSCPIPAAGDIIQISVIGNNYTCTDVTTGASATTFNADHPSGSPAFIVDQRPSTTYAIASFEADCIPTCNSPVPPSSLITFNPPAGSYNSAQSVAISTTVSPSTIHYTTDGTPPTTSSPVYNSPINISSPQTLRAIAVASGSADYVINVPVTQPPIFNPDPGTYSSAITVTIAAVTRSSSIHYTTDGSTPTTSSPLYTGPFTVSTTTTVNAIAVVTGSAPSAVSTATYTISNQTSGQTWYVNGGGGSRYSVNNPNGQCNGKFAAPYPGSGVNQDCAFNDIRYLWSDGSYTTDPNAGAPAWGWIGSGGDTYLIDCGNGASCRIGQNGPNSGDFFGLAGNPYAAGAPSPLSGTPQAHTKIFGINYQNCTSSAAKAHVNGGYGLQAVFSFFGSSYVDFACFDITDFSSCGLSGQVNQCHKDFPVDDYAKNGIQMNNSTTHTTFTDVYIHGMANAGMFGATGDGVSVSRVSVVGNPSSGWNMDDGSGTTGTGFLSIDQFSVLWNGCAEEYPIVHDLPFADCTDDNAGGYGDGVGTPTVDNLTAWIVRVNHSTAAYNTQDGFDLLHLQGGGSGLIISNTLAYGNQGQQLKLGADGAAYNNLIVGNCNALRQAIPGTPPGYNSRLSDFCRAADVPVVVAVGDGGLTTRFEDNTLYTANSIGIEVAPFRVCSNSCFLRYQNNIFLGFQNSAENGYPSGGSGNYPAPIYFDTGTEILSASGSSFSNNVTFNPKNSWPCPNTGWNELNAICSDPGLVDETFPLYGFGNMSPAGPNSNAVANGTPIAIVIDDYAGALRSKNAPTIGAYENNVSATSIASQMAPTGMVPVYAPNPPRP